jgi:hypothetical protein
MLYDTKGRFVLNKISADEAKYKILKIVGSGKQAKNVPYIVSHDGRTIRYPDPIIKKNDSVKFDLAQGKVVEVFKFKVGNTVMVTKGRNTGRVGTVMDIEKHPGSFDIAHIKDARGHVFAVSSAPSLGPLLSSYPSWLCFTLPFILTLALLPIFPSSHRLAWGTFSRGWTRWPCPRARASSWTFLSSATGVGAVLCRPRRRHNSYSF